MTLADALIQAAVESVRGVVAREGRHQIRAGQRLVTTGWSREEKRNCLRRYRVNAAGWDDIAGKRRMVRGVDDIGARAGEVASAPLSGCRVRADQRVRVETDTLVVEKEEGLLLAVVDMGNAHRTAERSAEVLASPIGITLLIWSAELKSLRCRYQ